MLDGPFATISRGWLDRNSALLYTKRLIRRSRSRNSHTRERRLSMERFAFGRFGLLSALAVTAACEVSNPAVDQPAPSSGSASSKQPIVTQTPDFDAIIQQVKRRYRPDEDGFTGWNDSMVVRAQKGIISVTPRFWTGDQPMPFGSPIPRVRPSVSG